MNEQVKMMNQQQRMSMGQNQMISMSQPQILNPQLQQQPQQQQPQMMNRSYRMWPQPPMPPPSMVDQLKFQNPNNHNLKQFVPGKHPKPLGPRNNWKGKKVNKKDKRMDGVRRNEIGTSGSGSSIAGGIVGNQGGYKPPTLNDLQQQNRLKARRFFPKKKFYHNNNNNNNNNNRTAPYAPRNTSSYIIRAKKSGGIASLVSPCPVTPAVLPTPMFSPSREVLVDMAKEEWGVDGYGSMNGLIRLRSPGHEAEGPEDEEEEEGGSSESDVEEHVEVERRLDHDLSRFEMIYPNYSGTEYNNVLGNRVDDQDTHIAQLEEENLILKDRLFLMERELGDLRRRLLSLERQGRGYDEMNEEVVENETESETESHGDGHSLEDNNAELIERPMEGVGNVKGNEENRIEDDTEFAENEERVGKEREQVDGDDVTVEKESNEVGKEDEVDGGAGQVAREFYEHKNEDKFSDAELTEDQYSPTSKGDEESVEFDNDKSVDSFDSRRANFDSPPGSPWKRREEALYSGSDGAESSSPDASVADIMPMLDELHPLLEEDNPQPVGLSHDVSHAPSESSTKSSESDDESDDDVSEDQEEVEVADDENEDEEEEETRDTEGPKSAITWTEEDQRNLMDLGTSELERNQRLESLIARRRSRKNMSFTDEKSLIDLVTVDFMPPISTARQNPFDLPNDNYGPGLPPIPGSAPSILLPRCKRNPFDLPYDPSEEKPDLTGDTFDQEIITSQPKETFFRRHESFNVGPSIFGLNKKDTRFRPYFVPDVMAAEGTSHSPLQRHPSDLSDSKVSSVLETESQGSIEDLEYKNLNEEDVEDKNLNEELEGKDLTDEHIFKEPKLISKIEHATEDIGHGSQSSEEVECLVLGASDKRDIEHDDTDVTLPNVENHHDLVPNVFHEETAASSLVLDPSKICSKSATSEQKCSSQSSSSSSSEVGEKIFADKVVVRLSSEESTCHVETISEHPSPNVSDLNITSSSVEESSHLEPIYDASPPSIKKNTSSSSIASDLLLESETGHSSEREPVANNRDIEKSIPKKEQIFSSADSKELRLREAITDKHELDVAKLEISNNDEVFGSASALPVPVADSQTSIDSKSSTKEAPVSTEKARTTESLNVSKVQEVPPSITSPRSPESVKTSNTKVATEESESSKNGPVHKVSSLKDHEMGLPTLEPRPTGDIDLINKQTLEENADRRVLHDSIDDDVHVRESKGKGVSLHSQDVGADLAVKQVMKNDIDKPNTSLQQALKTESREASSSKNSESSLKKIVVSGISEADAGKIDQEVVKQEDKVTTTEKPNLAVELPQETGVVTGDVIVKKENHTSQAQVQVPVTSKENVDS